ncbi:MAG: hypothetical protein ACREJM_14870 [Candidatus Saccharimonadales bacterium]
MSETFACPQCGKSYSHSGRKPGKAVVCVCGRRFLVPAPEVRAPRAEVPLHPPSEPRPESRVSPSRNPAARTPPPAAPRPAPAPRKPAPQPQEPVAQDLEPQELEAEVVYPGHPAELPPAAEWAAPAAYASDPLAAMHASYEPLAPPPTARRAARSSTASSELFGLWLGRVVLFVVVPLAMLCVVIGHLQMYRTGGLIQNSGKAAPAIRRPAAPAARNLLNINAASMRTAAGGVEFQAHFTRGGFAPQPGQRYVWIISASQGTVEIPITPEMLTQQSALTGAARGAAARRFRSPCTTWVEAQPPGLGSRQRVSNEFRF